MPNAKNLKNLVASARRAIAREGQISRAARRQEEEAARQDAAAEVAAKAAAVGTAKAIWSWVTGAEGAALRQTAAGLFDLDLLPILWRDGTPAPAFHTGCWVVRFHLAAPGISYHWRGHPCGGTGGVLKSAGELAQALPPRVLAALAQSIEDGSCWESIRADLGRAGEHAKARFDDEAAFKEVLALEKLGADTSGGQ